jgi:hypothetical protein
MSMDTILTVKNEDLGRLGPEEAVAFFRELLWAEATSLAIGKNLINVPSAITVADGGIDAEVRDVQVRGGQGIIKQGLTRYQIKTGDFRLSQSSHVKEILFKARSKKLKTRVKSCLDQGGTLVIVLFGWDGAEPRDDAIIDKFREQLTAVNPEYANADIEIWQQNHLIGFLQKFPALALRANRRAGVRFETHWDWATHSDMRTRFIPGQPQEDFVSRLQTALRQNEGPVHVQVWGEAGIGKTRLVLEATDTDDLRPWVVYCAASRFRGSDLMSEILTGDFRVVLILDECNPETRAHVWNLLEYRSPRIELISIYNERDESSGMTCLSTPPLGETQVTEIIQGYGVPRSQAQAWARMCSGSPRVAHVVGSNLVNHPEDILKPPSTLDLWERYIVGPDDRDSQEVRQRRTVLLHLALFKRFGYGEPLAEEAKAVAGLVERADRQITWRRFQEIVRNLRDRRILQGENTLYITPKLLHIKLWIDWWDTHGAGFSLDDPASLPPTLLTWFLEMFEYAAGSQSALRTVRAFLDRQGILQQNPELLCTELGARFFRFLAKADPEGALECLKRTVGTWDRERLLQFTTGRREVVWALEEIARWGSLLVDSANLLLALGEAENETWSNNASGVFVDLFSTSEHRELSRTGASPQERFPVLKGALESTSRERRTLGLRACDRALQRVSLGPVIGPPRIVGKEPQLWAPQTYGELFDAYRQIWQYLLGKLDGLSDEERGEAADILVRNARSLAWFLNLSDMVIGTMKELARRPYVGKKRVLEIVTQILHYDGKTLPEETRAKWEELRDNLTGTDFASLMERYVGMDLLEDKFDEDGNQVDQTQPWIEDLARQAAENPGLLYPELEWLLTAEAKNGYRFGYELGKRDEGFALLPAIVEKQKRAGPNASVYFLGGYLRVLSEKDQEEWEGLMDSFAQDEELGTWVPELTWRLGTVSDRAALRILMLAEEGEVDVGVFQMLVYGGLTQGLSEDVFRKWIGFLLEHPDAYASHTALALYSHYYLRSEPRRMPPEELTFRVLANPALLEESEAARHDQMASYYWTEMGRAFVRLYPERSLELADILLEHFGERGTILGGFRSKTHSVLADILRQGPEETWMRISDRLGPPIDERAYLLKDWLRGEDSWGREEEGTLSMVPPEAVRRWVDEDVDRRAWYLASFVPKLLFREEGRICWAREVLVRYGTREDVRNSLAANFSTEGWTGPESLHHQTKKQRLLDFVAEEQNENVRQWVNEYVSEMDRRIESARIREEREDF